MSSIEKDERLLPLPGASSLQMSHPQEVPTAYAPIYEDDVFSEGRSIRDYFLVVYKRLPIILGMTILVTAVVAFYMYRLPAIYSGETVMVIQPPKPKATQNSRDVFINFGGDQSYYNTQLRLLKNPELMQKVVLKLGLYKDPNLLNKSNKGFFSSFRTMFGGEKTEENENSLPVLQNTDAVSATDITTLTAEEKARLESYANFFAAQVNVEQVQQTDLVNLKMTNTAPDLIPAILNTLADTHIKTERDRSGEGGKEVYEDLTKTTESLKNEIAQLESERLNTMRAENLPLTSDKGADYISQRLNTLSQQFLEAEDSRRKIQAEYEAARSAVSKGEAFAGVQEDYGAYINKARENILKMKNDLTMRLDDLDEKITDAEAKLADLKVRYTDDYKAVIGAKEVVEKLKKDRNKAEADGNAKITAEENKLIKNAGSETLTGLQGRLAAAQRREADLKGAYYAALNQSQYAGVATTKLTTLTNEIETKRTLLNTYIQKQKEIELTNNIERSDNMNISTRAVKPEGPIGPARNRNIFIAFLLTFALGIGLAFLLDYLDDSVKTSDDIGKHLGLPTLALIPHQSILEKRRKGSLQGVTGDGVTPSSTALVAIENSRSAMAEAYRHLRTSLLFSSAGKPPQTILVTSSQPSEGKTTTAINTAVTLAQAGADVVIIDCDLRRPRLHSHFAMDNNTGLTNYISGEKNLNALLKPYPAFPRLKVITSGPIPPNPAELLSSQDMKELLRELKANFKHIIVDSPPAISFTDAAILSTQVDGVVLVAMSGKSSIQLIRRFKQRLNSIGARLYGVVLNGIKPDSFEYGYYGYGYEYGYTYEASEDDSTPKMEDKDS